ncbi:hypothetical protein LP421_09185 [Rhizobium sp. RCAM05350]|nr:hypothetical protein LP421_09185 [Rhizobium sp. RCAM05350]
MEKTWSQEPETIAPEVDNGWAVEQWSEPAFDGADLERELELSIGYDEAQVETSEIQAQPVPRFEPEPDFSAAIAGAPEPEGAVSSPVFETPVALEPVEYSPSDVSAAGCRNR